MKSLRTNKLQEHERRQIWKDINAERFGELSNSAASVSLRIVVGNDTTRASRGYGNIIYCA